MWCLKSHCIQDYFVILSNNVFVSDIIPDSLIKIVFGEKYSFFPKVFLKSECKARFQNP